MLSYSILFEDDEFYYCEVYNENEVKRVKIYKEHYNVWKKDKIEK